MHLLQCIDFGILYAKSISSADCGKKMCIYRTHLVQTFIEQPLTFYCHFPTEMGQNQEEFTRRIFATVPFSTDISGQREAPALTSSSPKVTVHGRVFTCLLNWRSTDNFLIQNKHEKLISIHFLFVCLLGHHAQQSLHLPLELEIN